MPFERIIINIPSICKCFIRAREVVGWIEVFDRIFGFSTSEIFRGFLQLYGHLPCEHLASTGKQSDPTLRLVMIPRCRKTRWLERVGHGPACAHGDTAWFRILTESGIILWRHRLLNTIASKFLSESCACNLRCLLGRGDDA